MLVTIKPASDFSSEAAGGPRGQALPRCVISIRHLMSQAKGLSLKKCQDPAHPFPRGEGAPPAHGETRAESRPPAGSLRPSWTGAACLTCWLNHAQTVPATGTRFADSSHLGLPGPSKAQSTKQTPSTRQVRSARTLTWPGHQLHCLCPRTCPWASPLRGPSPLPVKWSSRPGHHCVPRSSKWQPVSPPQLRALAEAQVGTGGPPLVRVT